MKKLLLIVFAVIMSAQLPAQDTVRVVHINYISTFSKSLKYPLKVEWWVTKAKVSCKTPLARKDQFAPDPTLITETNLDIDYLHSGYDRGHNCPAADNECQGDKVLTECFYFSNMMPQPHISNAGDWKSVEVLVRGYGIRQDSVHVWSGGFGSTRRIGKDKVAVPTKTWKVIYIVKQKKWQAFLFNNTDTPQTGINSHIVDKSVIEKLTGFKFK